MRIINNPNYLFIALEKSYRITNKLLTSFSIKLEYINQDEDKVEIFQKVLTSQEVYEFFVTTDGKYVLSPSTEPKVYFTHFAYIREFILSETSFLLCADCHCGCKDGTTNCLQNKINLYNKYLALSSIYQTYIRLSKDFSILYNNPASTLVREFLDTIYNKHYYTLNNYQANQLLRGVLQGSIDFSPVLYKYHIGIYYIALYLEAKSETTNTTELNSIKDLYRYNEILPCLLKLGLNPNELELDFNKSETNLYYWQTSSVDTVQNVAASLTKDLLLSKPYFPIQFMYEGKVIPLTAVGKLVLAISSIANSDFTIKDSLGTDVTDDFDYLYDSATETALFVSQLSYSHSNIYFIFKRLI